MAAPRARAVLLGLVLALSAVLSPAAASVTGLHGATGLAGDGLAGDHVLELLRETARAEQAQATPAPPERPAFTLWLAPPPRAGHLFARAPESPRLELIVLAPAIASDGAARLSETRIRAFGLFEPISRPGSNRVSRDNATGYVFGLWGNRVGPTQKGLWTDPVTGMSYARARWLDTRTATWLSEDPAGAVDSPNLYAFVGWQPNMATDPMGLCLGVDNLPCSDWYLAWQEAQAKTAVTVVKGVAHGTVKTVDFASMGQISGLGARIGTFFGSGGSLTERAEAANAAGREHSLDVVTLGFYSAPDRREHAKGLANNALGLEAQRQGSAMAFEGVAEGDWEKSIRGGAEWLGGASQTVLTIAGIGEGVQTLARPKTPVGSVAPQADIVYRRVTAGDRPQFVSQGLQPRDPLASISPEQHVLGERNSQFISTTRDYEVAVRGYGRSRSPIAEVDLSKVNARIIDLTNPETLSTFASPEAIYNATRDAEVLIEGPIPPESIGRIHYPD